MEQAYLEGSAFSSHERYSERIAPDLLKILGDVSTFSTPSPPLRDWGLDR